MTVVLIGPPAAGKTRLGARIARTLGCGFIDTDKAITAEHGPIAAIFRDHGEPRFRELERAAVARALRVGGIVSLGGGAVLDPDTRAALADHTVILLTVDEDAVAARIGGGKRPLITGIESWRRLVDERMPIYRGLADHTVDTSARPIDAIAAEVAAWIRQGADLTAPTTPSTPRRGAQ